MLATNIFFSHSVFKRSPFQGRLNSRLCGKDLNMKYCNVVIFVVVVLDSKTLRKFGFLRDRKSSKINKKSQAASNTSF